MNLYFKNISIHNFQSIGNAEVELNNTGIVYVKGENLYEEFTESNGSGKSSIFESILWCLFGKTSNGVSDVKNHYAEDGCYVELDLSIDNVDYKIIRAQKHKTYKDKVIITKNSEDISGRNKTDSNKLILELLDVDLDIFTSIVILSQGFSSKLTSLTPTNRKDRLERLSGSAIMIEAFKDKLSNYKSTKNSELSDATLEYGKATGQLESVEQDINKLNIELNELLSKASEDIPDLKEVREQLDFRHKDLMDYSDKKSEIHSKFSDADKNFSALKSEISSCESKIEKLKNKKETLETTKECYTCGQPITDDKQEELKSEIDSELKLLELQLQDLNKGLSKSKELVIEYQKEKIEIDERYDELQSKVKALQDILDKYKDYENLDEIDNIKKEISDKESTLDDLKSNVQNTKDKVGDIEKSVEIITHCLSLTTKDFREYLLTNVIKFLNNRLYKYSKMLYNNIEVDYIYIDDNLNIYVGEYEYNTLSGGEKRKVDIALVFAQRDLALSISGMNCNLLVLDEIYDNLDETAISNVSSLIAQISDIDSMFVISHMKNVDIKYDSILKVTKDESRISTVSYE